MSKITKAVVDGLARGAKDSWIWCSELPGFGVRVQPTGRKTFVIRYRNSGATQRKLTIGRCCDMVPDKARELARKRFVEVAAGADPVVDRREAREAPTLADLQVRYQREHAVPFKKERSAKQDSDTWRLYILPTLGASKKVADVDRADALRLHGAFASKPSTANHALALLSKSMNLAEDWKWRPLNSNPCRRIKKYPVRKKSLILTLEQIAAVDRVLTEMEAEGTVSQAMAALVRLWMITGCRNSEIRTARRAWVDFNLKALLLPDSKVGQREIPLPDVALDIIRALPDNDWLIPSPRGGDAPLAAPWRIWKRIAARAGVPPEATPHTLRHTVGSVGHRAAGLSQKEVAVQLGHKQLSTSERYIHGSNSEQAGVAQRVANVMTAAWASGKVADVAALVAA